MKPCWHADPSELATIDAAHSIRQVAKRDADVAAVMAEWRHIFWLHIACNVGGNLYSIFEVFRIAVSIFSLKLKMRCVEYSGWDDLTWHELHTEKPPCIGHIRNSSAEKGVLDDGVHSIVVWCSVSHNGTRTMDDNWETCFLCNILQENLACPFRRRETLWPVNWRGMCSHWNRTSFTASRLQYHTTRGDKVEWYFPRQSKHCEKLRWQIIGSFDGVITVEAMSLRPCMYDLVDIGLQEIDFTSCQS